MQMTEIHRYVNSLPAIKRWELSEDGISKLLTLRIEGVAKSVSRQITYIELSNTYDDTRYILAAIDRLHETLQLIEMNEQPLGLRPLPF